MPQMAPYNWMLLNILFTMILIMFMTFLYFIYMPNHHNSYKSNFIKSLKLFKLKW